MLIFGVSVSEIRSELADMVKIFELSVTIVKRGGAKKEDDTLCTKMVSCRDMPDYRRAYVNHEQPVERKNLSLHYLLNTRNLEA